MYRATPEQYTFFCYFDVEKFTDPISVSLKKFGSCFIRKKQKKFTQNLPLNPNRSLNTVRKFEKKMESKTLLGWVGSKRTIWLYNCTIANDDRLFMFSCYIQFNAILTIKAEMSFRQIISNIQHEFILSIAVLYEYLKMWRKLVS